MHDVVHKNMNDKISFLYVLNGVIIGMALAKIISGYASFIENHKKYTLYWAQIVFTIIIFILLCQYWFMLLSWKEVEKSFWLYLVSLLYPLSLYLISYLLIPSTLEKYTEDKKCNVAEHYYNNKNWIYGITTFGFFLAFTHNVIFSEQTLFSKTQGVRILGLVFVFIMLSTKKKIIHEVGSVLALLLLIVFLLIKYNPLISN
jgi:hypothetical protein